MCQFIKFLLRTAFSVFTQIVVREFPKGQREQWGYSNQFPIVKMCNGYLTGNIWAPSPVAPLKFSLENSPSSKVWLIFLSRLRLFYVGEFLIWSPQEEGDWSSCQTALLCYLLDVDVIMGIVTTGHLLKTKSTCGPQKKFIKKICSAASVLKISPPRPSDGGMAGMEEISS